MKNITTELNNYKMLLAAVIAELLKLPEGRLVIRGACYYHVINGKEIGITKKDKLIRQLARKRSLLILKKKLERNISIVSKAIGRLENINHSEILSTMPASHHALPASYFHHPSMEKWLALPQKQISYKKGTKYETKNGIFVRSRSELMAANILEDYNIFYLYEPAFPIGGQTEFPDFILIDPISGKFIIWEHFGGLHFPGYIEKMHEKMELYIENGFIPFETIIYTFEFDINVAHLRRLIERVWTF